MGRFFMFKIVILFLGFSLNETKPEVYSTLHVLLFDRWRPGWGREDCFTTSAAAGQGGD
jgi:hypothetical protein